MTSDLIRLSNYTLEPFGDGKGLNNINLSLSKGKALSIVTDSPDDAHLLIRGLATLDPPKSGQFFYKGKELNFTDYRTLLAYKKKVGYIAPDATTITNRSMRDNLMLMRYYFEDSTSIPMSDQVFELCKVFDLERGLDFKPPELDHEENRLFVIVRELSKNPEILIAERPREFLRSKNFEILKAVLRNVMKMDVAFVFFSTDKAFTKEFSDEQIFI